MKKNQVNITSNNNETLKITGGCHCQSVRFSATVQSNTTVLSCNCTICSMTGFQHIIVSHENFNLESGERFLISYQFNTKQANHLFCSRCGVKSFYQPRSHPNSWSINTRCVDDFNATDWTTEAFDGKHWEQAHQKL